MTLVTRRRAHAPTIAYMNRRIQEGKSRREVIRCLKRYLYRLLENAPMRLDCSRSITGQGAVTSLGGGRRGRR
jgi:transposase